MQFLKLFFKPKKIYIEEVIEIAKQIKNEPDGSGGFVLQELLEKLTHRNNWKVEVNHKERQVFLISYSKYEDTDELNYQFETLYKLISIVYVLLKLEKDEMILKFREIQPDHEDSVRCWGPADEEGQKISVEIIDSNVRDFILSTDDVGIYKTIQLKALQENGFVEDDERRHHRNILAVFSGITVSILIGLGGFLITYLTS